MPIDWFLSLLQKDAPPSVEKGTEAVRRIAQALTRLDPERARYLAALAYLLARVARADSEITPEETARMRELLVERGHLAMEDAELVVELAATQHLDTGGTEDYLVAREFRRLSTPEQRLALVECLFAVSASSGTIRTIEDNEIRRITREIRVEHGDYIRIRSAFRDHLAVLQPPEDSA